MQTTLLDAPTIGKAIDAAPTPVVDTERVLNDLILGRPVAPDVLDAARAAYGLPTDPSVYLDAQAAGALARWAAGAIGVPDGEAADYGGMRRSQFVDAATPPSRGRHEALARIARRELENEAARNRQLIDACREDVAVLFPADWTAEDRARWVVGLGPDAEAEALRAADAELHRAEVVGVDEAWHNGFGLGLDQVPARPPEGYTEAEKRAFRAGHAEGFAVALAEGKAERDATAPCVGEACKGCYGCM